MENLGTLRQLAEQMGVVTPRPEQAEIISNYNMRHTGKRLAVLLREGGQDRISIYAADWHLLDTCTWDWFSKIEHLCGDR